ncbi:MAG: hypothetical protein HOD37_05160, partial [Bacteroidetes bacterium]|nr:hypothetical protein [Bacteroidota bacterium]
MGWSDQSYESCPYCGNEGLVSSWGRTCDSVFDVPIRSHKDFMYECPDCGIGFYNKPILFRYSIETMNERFGDEYVDE